jgi:hypothetical protein
VSKIKKAALSVTGRILRLVLLLLVFSSHAFSQEDNNEYNIKSLFLLNFIKYVNWPEEQSTKVIKVGIKGDSPLYESLISMIKSRQETQKILVERITSEEQRGYHMVVLTGAFTGEAEAALKRFESAGVLVISDGCKSSCGAAINLLNQNNRIRFEINTTAARRGGVKISSKLAELAVKVQP